MATMLAPKNVYMSIKNWPCPEALVKRTKEVHREKYDFHVDIWECGSRGRKQSVILATGFVTLKESVTWATGLVILTLGRVGLPTPLSSWKARNRAGKREVYLAIAFSFLYNLPSRAGSESADGIHTPTQ